MAEQEKCAHCGGTGLARPNILKALRAGRDQSEVAAACGITQSAYSRLEKSFGKGPAFWNRHLRALAEFFHVTTDQLLGRAPLAAPKKRRVQRPPNARSLAKSAKARREIGAKNRRRRH